MAVIGRHLLADAKAHVQSDTSKSAHVNAAKDDGNLGGRDLFSLLVKANAAGEAGADKLSDADVLSRASLPLPLPSPHYNHTDTVTAF